MIVSGRYWLKVIIAAAIGGAALMGSGISRAAVDHSIYADLLRQYVKDGVVDYRGFKNDEPELDRYLDLLAQIKPLALNRAERFAFYVNAYNAWTVKLVLTRYPRLTSIKDLGSFLQSPWKKKIARIDGDILTLDQIEHEILRPRFKDPRVHFAVNCASRGCPPLLSEPYTGERLNRQLDGVTRAFVNDPRRNRLEGDVLYVSKIFKWFAEDFDYDIVGFFRRYADGKLANELQKRAPVLKIKYLDYDWSLNGN